MLSSATPSPLDQLAGIEQLQREEAALLDPHARHDSLWIREKEAARRRDALNAAAATLATLREGLVGFGIDQMRELLTRVRNGEQPSAVLLSLLTPDSPRQAGEEITDG